MTDEQHADRIRASAVSLNEAVRQARLRAEALDRHAMEAREAGLTVMFRLGGDAVAGRGAPLVTRGIEV